MKIFDLIKEKLKFTTLQLYISFLIFKLLDVATTFYFLTYTNIPEGNPIVTLMFETIGLNLGLIVNFVVAAFATYILYKMSIRSGNKISLYLVNVLGILVVINNIIGIAFFHYLKGFPLN